MQSKLENATQAEGPPVLTPSSRKRTLNAIWSTPGNAGRAK
jgi:hypothetical protein